MKPTDRELTAHAPTRQALSHAKASWPPDNAPACTARPRAPRPSLHARPPGGPGHSCPSPLTPSWVLAAVATTWDVTPAEVCGPSRQRRLVDARHVVVYLARNLLGVSWSEAAELVGRGDHTTAISAYRRIARSLGTDPALVARIAWVLEALGAQP